MTLLIAGDGFAAAEAAFLAGEAGIDCLLAAARPDGPPAGLCGGVLPPEGLRGDEAELVLPAGADGAALAGRFGGRCIFDPALAARCASKTALCAWLRETGAPVPADFPEGSEPYLVRPADGRGGLGIWTTEDFCEAGGAVNCGFTVQEYLDGPVCSLLVLGLPGDYCALPAVTLGIGDRWERRRAAVSAQAQPWEAELAALGLRLAERVELRGAMELKAVVHEGRCRVLTLDARLPELTPTALWLGTGLNVVEELCGLWQSGRLSGKRPARRGAFCECLRGGRPAGLRELEDAGRFVRGGAGLLFGDGVFGLRAGVDL